jgi:hypothetical protein
MGIALITTTWLLLTVTGGGVVSHDAGYKTEASCQEARTFAIFHETTPQIDEDTKRDLQLDDQWRKDHPPEKIHEDEVHREGLTADTIGYVDADGGVWAIESRPDGLWRTLDRPVGDNVEALAEYKPGWFVISRPDGWGVQWRGPSDVKIAACVPVSP